MGLEWGVQMGLASHISPITHSVCPSVRNIRGRKGGLGCGWKTLPIFDPAVVLRLSLDRRLKYSAVYRTIFFLFS